MLHFTINLQFYCYQQCTLSCSLFMNNFVNPLNIKTSKLYPSPPSINMPTVPRSLGLLCLIHYNWVCLARIFIFTERALVISLFLKSRRYAHETPPSCLFTPCCAKARAWLAFDNIGVGKICFHRKTLNFLLFFWLLN